MVSEIIQRSQTSSITFRTLYRTIYKIPDRDSVTQFDIMELPPALVTCCNKIARNGSMTAADFAESLGLTPRQAYYLARLLIRKGFLRAEVNDDWDNATFRINYQQRARRRTSSAVLDTLTFSDD